MSGWTIRPFYKHPQRKRFSCGEPELDTYLSDFASQHEQSGLSRTFLAFTADDATRLGYYTLSMSSIPRTHLPASVQRRFPAFPVPVARLVRLAVEKKYQGSGTGEYLFMAALQQCYHLSLGIGMVAVVVDAKHDRAARFYQRYGFEALPDQPLLLWLNVRKLKFLFE
ncbi:MAG: GNAT family N-acetyltransferase [Thiothrix sp.]|nr:GNAT family N-acetyltransferase [Thiothrix sp.]HPE61770.1 GNAT family N-acetyltransferase [Thiolinea sp.]